jgi:uncharacterized protein
MLSERTWKPEAVVRLLLSVFLCMVGSALLVGIVQHLGGIRFKDSPWRAVVAALSFQGVALFFVHFFVREHGISWSSAFGFASRWKRALFVGVVAALIFLPVGLGMQSVIVSLMKNHGYEPDTQQAVQALEFASGWLERAALAGVAVVLAPLAEEILFRGILYTAVKQFGFPRLALWGTSVLFAVVHLNLPAFLPLLVLALTLTLLYEKTGNLLASIPAHSLFNTINFVMYYAAEHFKWLFPDPQ